MVAVRDESRGYDPEWDRERFDIEGADSDLLRARPNEGLRRQLALAEDKVRQALCQEADRMLRRGLWSNAAYDLFVAEVEAGYFPRVEWSEASGWYTVKSAKERATYSLDGWERHAQELLPLDDPDKQTGILDAEALNQLGRMTPPLAWQPRAWHPALDSAWQTNAPRLRVTPDTPPQIPAIPTVPQGMGMPAPTSQRLTPQPSQQNQPRPYWPPVSSAIQRAVKNLKPIKRERE